MLAAVLICTAARAYDFSAVVPSGQTLYFSLVPGGVAVVYPASTIQPVYGWNSYTRPVGALSIPSTITHNGVAYNVVAVNNHALYGCSGLTELSVAEGVRVLRSNALNQCSGLTSVTLPASLDTLGTAALSNCSSLTTLALHCATPPVVYPSTFASLPDGISVEVPCAAYDDYLSAQYWNSVGTIVPIGCYANLAVGVNSSARGSVSGGGSHLAGSDVTIQALPSDGFFFACWNDGDTSNPRIVTLSSDTSFTAFLFAVRTDTVTLYDTVRLAVIHTDTVTIHDTVRLAVLHTDTVTLRDTVLVPDTLTLHDTVYPTFFRLTVSAGTGGVGIGNTIVPAGTECEIGALPVEGHRFVGWDDGSPDNPRRVVVTGNVAYTALFETMAAAEVLAAPAWSLAVDGRTLAIGCHAGEQIRIYSIDGRLLLDHTAAGPATRIRLDAPGAYLVQVGLSPARKAVVE